MVLEVIPFVFAREPNLLLPALRTYAAALAGLLFLYRERRAMIRRERLVFAAWTALYTIGITFAVTMMEIASSSSGEFPTDVSNALNFAAFPFPFFFLNYLLVRGVEIVLWLRSKRVTAAAR